MNSTYLLQTATTAAVIVVAIGACDDFASPAELSRPQILAIQSVPASVDLSESAELSVFLAGPDGPIENTNIEWSIESDFGLVALGDVVVSDGKATYTAPLTAPKLPTLVSLEARIQQEGKTLIGIKAILIGGPTLSNPTITAITQNDTPTSELVLTAGSTTTLGLQMDATLSEDATYAWYANPGIIDEYRSSPTTIVAPDEPGMGWIYVVVRDRGGVAYHAIPTQVQ